MPRALIIIIILLLLIFGLIFLMAPKKEKPMSLKNQNLIRYPAVAGEFYPSQKKDLEKMIDDFLKKVLEQKIKGKPRILIVPHAGYVFSGQTAAHGFKSLAGIKYNKVVLLGNSHIDYFDGLLIDESDFWHTPLGQVEIDKELINKLVKDNEKIIINQQVHLPEHSLEVEVPFLQKVLSEFKLIPGLFGSQRNLDDFKSISQSLAKIIDDQTLIVISTDLSHYPRYKDANLVDNKTIEAILSKDVENFLRTIDEIERKGYENLSTCACGWPAVAVGMYLAHELNLTGGLLNYTNSGDIPLYGDKERVVGYAAVAFSQQLTINPSDEHGAGNQQSTIDKELDEQEQGAALKLARNTLEKAFNPQVEEFNEYKKYPIFEERRGVFVTLRKNKELRGCIGLIEPLKIPLAQSIQEMALSAAFKDLRFLPLEKDELDEIKIEISVLSVPQKVKSADEIILGKHGVIVRKDNRSGVFLPQVAEETGWTKEKFLSELCSQKAGLDRNCWQDPSVEFYIYEAQVFEE